MGVAFGEVRMIFQLFCAVVLVLQAIQATKIPCWEYDGLEYYVGVSPGEGIPTSTP